MTEIVLLETSEVTAVNLSGVEEFSEIVFLSKLNVKVGGLSLSVIVTVLDEVLLNSAFVADKGVMVTTLFSSSVKSSTPLI